MVKRMQFYWTHLGVRHDQNVPKICESRCINMKSLNQKVLKKAFRIIRRNYGCPGNDGISISDIRRNYESYELKQMEQLESRTFEFDPHPKKITISDYLGKKREIFVYSVLERWAQEYIKLHLAPFVERELTESAFAFRQNKNDKESYIYILANKPKYILRIDIKNFFECIDKERLLRNLEEIKIPDDILYWVRESLRHCPIGLPQGNVLSCMLSNLSLTSFDKRFPTNYTRYGDDMMFACSSKEEACRRLKYATKWLGEQGFLLNQLKTQILS